MHRLQFCAQFCPLWLLFSTRRHLFQGCSQVFDFLGFYVLMIFFCDLIPPFADMVILLIKCSLPDLPDL